MGTRLELQTLLKTICPNVYFQPANNVDMQYDCIRYHLDDIDTKFAGNKPYALDRKYLLTLITRSPDSDLVGKIAMLPKCLFDRSYTAEGLNHYVYSIFF